MIKGKTSSGFRYTLKDGVLTDWRIIKKLARLSEMEDEAESSVLDFINIMSDIEEIIFPDKGEAFEKYILDHNDGIIAPQVALKDLMEILKSNEQTKN